MEIPNLWGDFIFKQNENTPLNILKKQAEYLVENSKGILRGKVERFACGQMSFNFFFKIEAPFLDNYTYNLFTFRQEIGKSDYPCEIEYPSGIFDISSEQELISALKAIFASSNTQKVIQTLISQSEVNK